MSSHSQKIGLYSLMFVLFIFSKKINAQFCQANSPIITVFNTNDDGPGSLREAIKCANEVLGTQTIKFSIPGNPPHIINVGSVTGQPLPSLLDDETIIDGSTQLGFSGDPLIILDGGQTTWTGPYNAVYVLGDKCEIYGLTIRNFPDDGIDVNGAKYTRIGAAGKGNVIYNNGIDQDIFPNFQGLWNGCGIVVRNQSDSSFIQGNFIGTNYSQSLTAGNEYCGIIVRSSCLDVLIGGTQGGEANVIANNAEAIRVDNSQRISMRENSIYCNDTAAIHLLNNGNFLKPAPIINFAEVEYISGSGPSGELVEVFLMDSIDCGGTPCQGKIHLGTVPIVNGIWTLLNPNVLGNQLTSGMMITATITTTDGNTSAFAPCRTIINADTCSDPDGTIWVTNTADDGIGSLRFAIDCANIVDGPNVIKFNIPDSISQHRIFVGSQTGQALPALFDKGTTIDATTQPGFDDNDFAPKIVLDGIQNQWTQPINAIWVRGDSCEIYGLEIVNFPDDGIDVAAANHVIIGAPNKGNVLMNNGYDQDFFSGQPNSGPWNGCAIVIRVGSSFCTVQGNFIGTDYLQDSIAGNEYCGVIVQSNCQSVLIGGDGVGEENVIAHNELGVRISASSKFCQIQQNSMFCNDDGIILQGNGNEFQAPPIIDSVDVNVLLGKGIPGDLIEVFVNDTMTCADVNCQGTRFLGTSYVGVDSSWTLAAPFANGEQLYGGNILTATATDSMSNTSAFADCKSILISCNTIVIDFVNVEPSSCGEPNGGFEVEVNGGYAPYTFDFGNGLTDDPVQDSLMAGWYYFSVIDTSGCVVEDSIQVLGNDPIIITEELVSNEGCDSGNGVIILGVTGGMAPFQYDIGDGNQADSIFENLSAGFYNIIITDGAGCQDSIEIVLENIPVAQLSISNLVPENCEMSDGSFTVNTTGGTGPFLFDIGNGKVGNATFTGLTSGNYSVTVTDFLGCVDSISATILEADPIIVTVINLQNASCGFSNGGFEISATGGVGSYTYDFGNGVTSNPIFNNLPAGNYQVTITDSPGCTAVIPVVISDTPIPTFTLINIMNENCGQSDASFEIEQLGGTPPYLFDIGTGQTSNPVFENLNSGIYNIVILDSLGCSSSQVLLINENFLLLNIDEVVHANCGEDNGSILVSGNEGTPPYTFDIGNGPTSNPFFENLSGGTYTVTVMDSVGCSAEQVVEILATGVTTFSFINITDENCGQADGSFEIAASGGNPPYTFDIGNGPTSNPVFENLSAGNYQVTVSDADDCSVTQEIDLLGNNISLSIDQITPATCGSSNGEITVSSTGGVAPINYDIGNGGTTNPVFQNLSNGNYNITVTDANGCTDEQLAIVPSDSPITISFTNVQSETCGAMNAMFTVIANNGTAPYTYDIGFGSTDNNTFTNIGVGVYTVTVTDVNDCPSTANIFIEGTGGPSLIIGDVFHETCEMGNGGISVIPSGGVPPYSFDFGNGATDSNVEFNLSAGNYMVTITDANGCQDSISTTIVNLGGLGNAGYTYNNNILTVDFESTSTNAFGHFWEFGDGATALGNSPSHTYLTAGNYEVCLTVTNACGANQYCETITVTLPPDVVFDLSTVSGGVGDTVYLSLTAANFIDIFSFQKSIHIADSTVAKFIGVSSLNLPNLDNSDFNISNQTISVDWTSGFLNGVTVAPTTVIYKVGLELLYKIDCSDILIDGTPFPMEVVRVVNGTNVNIGVQGLEGEVCVTGSLGNTVEVSGAIFKENAEVVANVNLSCTNAPNPNYQTTAVGVYEFLDLPNGGDFTITPFKNDGPSNGLTVLDLIAIQQHILGTNFLDSPYKIIAADANNSKTITALDLVAINNVILGNISNFPNNTSWRFVPVAHVFQNNLNPFFPDFPEEIVLNNLTGDSIGQDFIAIKIGDVNLTSTPSLTDDPNEEIVLLIDNQSVIRSGELVVNVKIKNFNHLKGWQLDLGFDAEQLIFEEIMNIQLPSFGENNIGLTFLENGILPIVWFDRTGDENGINWSEDEPIFSLKFKIKDKMIFDENLFFIKENRLTPTGLKGGKKVDVKLLLQKENLAPENEMKVFPPRPNPFGEVTTLNFFLPKTSAVTFSIFNQNGKLIYSDEKVFEKGGNQIKVFEKDLPHEGLYFYKIENSTNQFSGKMFFFNG